MDNKELLTAIGTMVDDKLNRFGLESDRALDANLNGFGSRLETRIMDKTQNVIFAMEERLNARFHRVDVRLERIEREMTLMNETLTPFIKWSHAVENDIVRVSEELIEVRARLAKLENPNAS
jgi:hypothetical protein